MPDCGTCQQPFDVRDTDRVFYSNYDLPLPTQCPRCRERQRWACSNDTMLYPRTCDATQKNIISIYAPASAYTVYSNQYWYSDAWDPLSYGREVDFNRPFFEQFHELKLAVPRLALSVVNCDSSPFVNNCGNMDKCYLCANSGFSNECFYTMWGQRNRNCVDVFNSTDSELSYELLDSRKAYHSGWLLRCDNMMDSYFCVDSKQCSKCILCSGLENKTLHILNKPVDEQTYRAFVASLSSHAAVREAVRQWRELVKNAPPEKKKHLVNVQNVSGHNVRAGADCADVHDCEQVSNVHYSSNLFNARDCHDISAYGDNLEFSYQSFAAGGNSAKLFFTTQCGSNSNNVWYSDFCGTVSDVFGCVGIRKKANCILNKQYSAQEYASLVEKLKVHMKETGEWGRFFPPSVSAFGYNESSAALYFPLEKNEALQLGFAWQDNAAAPRGKETLKAADIPDTLQEAGTDIASQVISCEETGRNYKIITQELAFHKLLNIALPRRAPETRLRDRLQLRNQ